ncbi:MULTISPECIES: hypothetical protein [Alcanivoracaceae]|uniref:hypothetical protein n=1 Tax=Alcanivoracaceae TaxID=224372 RepID=UPI0013C4667A|nr:MULTISPECIES: hypothetical protein [Alcanivoracaceae]MBZ2190476.1 hypothetical protein [Alcanivorax limicola]
MSFHIRTVLPVIGGLVLLGGCQGLGNLSENMSCNEICVQDHPSFPEDQAVLAELNTLVVLEPDFVTEVRAGNGEVLERITRMEHAGLDFWETVERHGNAYGFTQSYLPYSEDHAAPVAALHAAIWADEVQVEQLRRGQSANPFASKDLGAPTQVEQVSLDDDLRAILPDQHCCLMITRHRGWRLTRGSATSSQIADAISHSFGTGARGFNATADAVIDAAVIDVESGAILWSARLIGPDDPARWRSIIARYYNPVNNAALAQRRAAR